MQSDAVTVPTGKENRNERVLWVLSAATFLIFFQAYMVAPLIPRFAALFGISAHTIGLVVPAFGTRKGVFRCETW
jgi:predicted MFS family arabinose efflux permease